MSGLAILRDALRLFGSVKHLALAAGVDPRTASRYRTGETLPDLPTAIRLMSVSREFRNAVLHAAGCDDVTLELETIRLTRLLAELQEQRIALYAELYPQTAAVSRDAAGEDRAVAPGAEAQRGLKR